MTDFHIDSPGGTIAGEVVGEGPPVLLLHGLTATRRYVVMGSSYLERHGYRVVAYDARGHGESSPAPAPGAYEYSDLVADLGAVMDELGIGRALLAGASMGAHTAVAFAIAHPERVAALVLITPAYDGAPREDDLAHWDALSAGLRDGGADAFLAALEPPADPRWRETALTVARQRIERHLHPEAVADALRVVPRSAAFDGLAALEQVHAPTLIVASRDEADPGHPLRVAEAYHSRLPRSELIVEPPGKSPIAWQGAQLSRAIAELAQRAGYS
ncbi:MAG: alpha/beta hydrolase [Thermoleophilaceae bacterium]|nr:alpha/beta hydrolase [Thermoleophilaceae bacterium]